MGKIEAASGKTKLARTPMLKPGDYSAYEVLRFVRGIIAQEPRRLNMKEWLSMLKGVRPAGAARLRRKLPACGTVACLAGWVNTVTGVNYLRNGGAVSFGLGSTAIRELGLSTWGGAGEELMTLFHSFQLRPMEVLTRLDAFLLKHERELKEKSVVVVKRGRA